MTLKGSVNEPFIHSQARTVERPPSAGVLRRVWHWHQHVWPGANLLLFAGVLVVFLLLWNVPSPSGLSTEAWHLFALFVFTIVGAIVEPLPISAMCLIALGICSATGVLTTSEMLSGFANEALWLVMFAFFLSSGFVATGLGRRLCFIVLKYLGATTIGLGYGICFCELLLAIAIPSVSARAVGVIMPILKPLMTEAFQSDPEFGTQGRIGTYIVLVEITANAIAGACWMTGGAWNAMTVQLMEEVAGEHLSWVGWATALLPVGLVPLALVPIVVYLVFPPEIKSTPEAAEMATTKLEEMGPMSIKEKAMLSTFIGVVLLWILSSTFKTTIPLSAAGVAGMGVAVLLFLGVISVKEHIATDKAAFNLLIWFGVLLMLSAQLKAKGFFSWVAGLWSLSSLSPLAALLLVCFIFYITQYGFASITAHVSALFTPLLEIAIKANVPAGMACRALAFCTLAGHIAPYTSSTNPGYFALGYVSLKQWWTMGLVFFAINFVVLCTIGFGYWRIIGY
ncbi:hypothetical protein FOL47_003757 [Perkinsus chesapeaki]|uniref:Uncharacterized protein n=1 Tax=Perkinsus chesapeaki TaxID=330153 RepID=A0A7J6N059_PERCH|nr:hypothetical protein FOL47_003757 [Perkinsus chesapeaki]